MEGTWEDTRRGAESTSCSNSGRTSQGVIPGGQVANSSSWKSPAAIPLPHCEFCSATHADAGGWLQSTEPQLRRAAENKRGSFDQGESGTVEATQQLCLLATSGSEEPQASRREEQSYYTPCCVDSISGVTSPYGSRSDDRHEQDDTANYKYKRNISQPLATYAMQVNSACNSAVEQSGHAQLQNRCLRQGDTLSSQRTLEGAFLSAAQHFTPAEQRLLLSRTPPGLLLTCSYDKQGEWAPLCQHVSGNQREDEAAEIAADNNTDQEDGERCVPCFMPESEHASTSPTSSFCTPSNISANRPVTVPPQLSTSLRFRCSTCNRSFTRKGSLNRHMQSHLDIRPFSCSECPKAFLRRYHLREHMRVHQHDARPRRRTWHDGD